MKKERQLRILYTLLSYKKLNIDVITKAYDISKKTWERDFEDINLFLSKKGQFKIIESDNAIHFIGSDINLLEYLHLDDSFLLKEERLIYIFMILLRDIHISKTQLIDDLDVSIKVLENDINELKNIFLLNETNLSINSRGIKISSIQKDKEIKILIDIIIQHLSLKKVYSILKLNSIEKLFSSYIYKFLDKKYNISIYNKIFIWILEHTSNQYNISNYEIIVLSIKITLWLNHPNNKELMIAIVSLDNQKDFYELVKKIYCTEELKLFTISNYSSNNFSEDIDLFIEHLNKQIKKLFKSNMYLNQDIQKRIKDHIKSNLDSTNIDEIILAEYNRNLSQYINSYNDLWKVIKDCVAKFFNNSKVLKLIQYEIFIHILVWFDTYIYELDINILTICIGGMGQSAMIKNHLASMYRNAKIENAAFSNINKQVLKRYDIIISAVDLSEFKIENYILMPLILILKSKNEIHKVITETIYKNLIGGKMQNQILKKENILINQKAKDKHEAILQCGQLLKSQGYIEDDYISSMIEREKKFSVYIGNYLAIPHGLDEKGVIKDGIVVIHYKEPIDYDSNPVNFFIGIAAKSNNHIDILSNIAEKMMELDFVEELIQNPSEERILEEFNF
ncbi:PTS system, mannitol-specific IIA component [Spiroplasma gladiatoris]|uniref:PTS system, mannitol-specific IIA component n=1 Tax=Spiroplasma gladiatoris TaxID=2143 RepID=A0A4P7AKB3_9MOLU|nr:PTS sugar transporter subunit IIA [Spiroplasma gladiatoris]QBQ08106.1 PTS system, mannitol-specific IIA component [Spiroplasma gladiatoris]